MCCYEVYIIIEVWAETMGIIQLVSRLTDQYLSIQQNGVLMMTKLLVS